MHRISREKHSRGQSLVVNYVHCLVLLSEKKKDNRKTERERWQTVLVCFACGVLRYTLLPL